MHYQSVKRKLPEPNVEVIGFNKHWINHDEPDGTRICTIRNNRWVVVAHNQFFEYKELRIAWLATNDITNSMIPTHWCSKPIPPITLK